MCAARRVLRASLMLNSGTEHGPNPVPVARCTADAGLVHRNVAWVRNAIS